MEALIRELRRTVRSLLKTPGLTTVAVVTLALGIGANTALFSVVYEVLLKPLPFPAPERLISLWEHGPDDSGRVKRWRVTAGNFFDWRDESSSFEEMALFGAAGFNWTGRGEPEQLLGARVSEGYFEVLGVEPVVGRRFLPEESRPGKNRVVILGHGLWQRRFGGSTDVVGQRVTLDGAPYEIVGVLPPGVYPTWPQATGRIPFLPLYQEIWVPMVLGEERRSDRRSHVFGALGRLREDVSFEQARAEMNVIGRRLEKAHPEANASERILLVPYLDEVVGGVRPALYVLLGAVGVVLLIACANIASLFLARAHGRRREVAIRAALGAGRRALVTPFLSESFAVAGLAGVLGVVLAALGAGILIRFSPQEIPRLEQSGLSPTVLGFAFLLSVAAALFFGIVPALGMTGRALHAGLGVRSPEATGLGRLSVGRLLVVAEVSLAVVLVAGAGLLLQSFLRLQRVDPGFSAREVLVAELSLPPSKYRHWQSIDRFYRRLLERIEALPDVERVALGYDHPLESNWIDSFRLVEDRETETSSGATFRIVSSSYFRTLGIELVRGRAFTERDDTEHPGAVIVNQAFVRRYFEGANPIGRRLRSSTPRGFWGEAIPDTFEIVGVVRNVKFLGPTEDDEPAFYVSARQFPQNTMLVFARGPREAAALASRVREAVWSLDPTLPVSSLTTMDRLLSEALAQPRFNGALLGLFGLAALLLAALGLYGLLSHAVARRTGELGIRMALGARPRDVIQLVVGEGMKLTAPGLALGLLAALGLTRVLSSLLFGVSETDPVTFAAVPIFLAVVAVVASYLPARRATRVSPLTALRHE